MKDKVVIVGGGIGGLTAAHELIERGFEVHVYERRAFFGGKAASVRTRRDGLPGEHGFRFFPGWYRHLPDTLARIPYRGKRTYYEGATVLDNLVRVSRDLLVWYDRDPISVLMHAPRSLEEARAHGVLMRELGQLGLAAGEMAFFVRRMLEYIAMPESQRREQLGQMTWWQYMDADNRSRAFREMMGATTRLMVAAKANEACAYTIGKLALRTFADALGSIDQVLNGPTNEVWIDPWLAHLEARGVKFHTAWQMDSIEFCEDKPLVRSVKFNRVALENLTRLRRSVAALRDDLDDIIEIDTAELGCTGDSPLEDADRNRRTRLQEEIRTVGGSARALARAIREDVAWDALLPPSVRSRPSAIAEADRFLRATAAATNLADLAGGVDRAWVYLVHLARQSSLMPDERRSRQTEILDQLAKRLAYPPRRRSDGDGSLESWRSALVRWLSDCTVISRNGTDADRERRPRTRTAPAFLIRRADLAAVAAAMGIPGDQLEQTVEVELRERLKAIARLIGDSPPAPTAAASDGGLGRTIVDFFAQAEAAFSQAEVDPDLGPQQEEGAYFVFALPLEQMAYYVSRSPTMTFHDPALRRVVLLSEHTDWMAGIQYFLEEPFDLVQGHVVCMDSEWALTAIEQSQFWRDVDLTRAGADKVRGVLSVDIAAWDRKGRHIRKEAFNCTDDEIAEEVWEQLKAAINRDGRFRHLRDDMLRGGKLKKNVSYHLDDSIVDVYDRKKQAAYERARSVRFSTEAMLQRQKDKGQEMEPPYQWGGRLRFNVEPLLVNRVGALALRPEANTGISNMFLAADYVRTETDLACMEGANEAARRAVNALLDAAGSTHSRCEIFRLVTPQDLVARLTNLVGISDVFGSATAMAKKATATAGKVVDGLVSAAGQLADQVIERRRIVK
jgi:uncharacterized protein with NAD-binding domain and iron-sulfur cluster